MRVDYIINRASGITEMLFAQFAILKITFTIVKMKTYSLLNLIKKIVLMLYELKNSKEDWLLCIKISYLNMLKLLNVIWRMKVLLSMKISIELLKLMKEQINLFSQ